jgi:hypothetical protein
VSPQPQAAVGAPLSRVDGRLKVTGRATFAAEHDINGVVHAVVVDSSVGLGRITGIDTRAALAQPGVLKVISHLNAPKLAYRDNAGSNNPPGRRLRVFQDDKVLFHGQPVAVVVADTLEGAQHAASLVKVSYDAEKPSTDLTHAKADEPTTYARGDVDKALQSAAVRLEMTYRAARNNHNPMEPHAAIARWDGDKLTVWDKTQWVVGGTQTELGAVFGIPLESVRVISPFVGGGFGSALRTWPHTTIAALAARETARPVKLVLTRRQLYFGTGFRPAYEYKVRLGSDRRGRLTAMTHDVRAETSSYETFTEAVLVPGQMLYSMHQRPTGLQHSAVGRAHPALHARPRLRHRLLRHRVGDGRTRPRAGRGPDRAAPTQRTRRRPVQRAAVLHPAAARVLHHRGRRRPPRETLHAEHRSEAALSVTSHGRRTVSCERPRGFPSNLNGVATVGRGHPCSYRSDLAGRIHRRQFKVQVWLVPPVAAHCSTVAPAVADAPVTSAIRPLLRLTRT